MTLGTTRMITDSKRSLRIGGTLTHGLALHNEAFRPNEPAENGIEHTGGVKIGIMSDQYVGLKTDEYDSVGEVESLKIVNSHRNNPVTSESAVRIGLNMDAGSKGLLPPNHEEPFPSLHDMMRPSADKSDQRKVTSDTKRERSKSESSRVPNYKMADILMDRHRFAIIENNLYYWDESRQYWDYLVGDKADVFIRRSIPTALKGLITFRTCEEIIQWLKTKNQLQISDEMLARRKAYVAFTNCVVKISDRSILNHSPQFYFTSHINAELPSRGQRPGGETFERFVQQATGGDDQIYLRLQELFGLVISEIREVKVIPFLLGPKDSGKSLVLRILEHLVGREFFTNLSLQELNQPTFLCQLFGKKLNTCAEVSEIALNRLDVFKKLSGGDYVMARNVFQPAFKFINKAVLLFAGNDLPTIRGIDRSNAFSQRLLIVPFKFQVPQEKQDIHLMSKLIQEMPYIAEWSLRGLQRWCRNNYLFSTSEEMEELSRNYAERNNSIRCFVENCCTLDPNLKTHNETLESAYREFCSANDLIVEASQSFHRTLQSMPGLRHSRFRLHDANKNGYMGIGLTSNSAESEHENSRRTSV